MILDGYYRECEFWIIFIRVWFDYIFKVKNFRYIEEEDEIIWLKFYDEIMFCKSEVYIECWM